MQRLLIPEIKWPPETFLMNKLNGLLQRGYQITLGVTSPIKTDQKSYVDIELLNLPRWDEPVLGRIVLLVYHLLRFATKEKRSFRKFAYLMRYTRQKPLRQWLNFLLRSLMLSSVHPDLVLFEWNASAVDNHYLLPLWQCPNVISSRGSQINVRPYLPGNDHYLAGLSNSFISASALHCVSNAIAQELSHFGAPHEKICVIKPAVDVELFSPSMINNQNTSPLKIISIGNLSWVKGYEYSLVSVKKALASGININYTIIGSGESYQHLVYTAHDLGLEDHVKFVGTLPHASVVEALHSADVLVLSSLSEGISNAVLEAMSCGLPVVTTDCGGMREAVTDGVEGFVVPVRDPQAMAAALLKLAKDPALRQRMGQAGRERIIKDFNLADQINAFVELFESLKDQKIGSLNHD